MWRAGSEKACSFRDELVRRKPDTGGKQPVVCPGIVVGHGAVGKQMIHWCCRAARARPSIVPPPAISSFQLSYRYSQADGAASAFGFPASVNTAQIRGGDRVAMEDLAWDAPFFGVLPAAIGNTVAEYRRIGGDGGEGVRLTIASGRSQEAATG